MLARLLAKPSNFRFLSSKPISHPILSPLLRKPFSSSNGDDDNKNSKFWNLSEHSTPDFDPFFDRGSSKTDAKEESWADRDEKSYDIFGEVRGRQEDYSPWVLDEDEKKDGLFDVGLNEGDNVSEIESREEQEKLLLEEEGRLSAVLKGPNRAFGDLIAASGITDEMLDSLIALKDFEDVDGLPPLKDIEDMRYEKSTRKSARAEIERQKQEEVAKARVRQVDDKGRAYGTGRRKCSIARVWIQPGNGNFLVNDKQFDVYFPMLDHRAALLQPLSETKTLGLWDINCTVKGGGVSGQVGAIQLGVSWALQNWEPDMRPALRSVGLLTRDPRVVERKKPGKAKARKSFQWVKR